MSKETIMRIKNAEAQAEQIRADATDEARERIRNAELAASVLCEQAANEAADRNAEKLRLTRQRADEVLAKSRKDAQKEADMLAKASAPYMGDAVRLIIGGIFEKCQ